MSKRTILLLTIGAIAALVVGWQVTAFATLTGSDFEGNDGNLKIDSTFDWNGFEPAEWTGTAPNRTSSAKIAGWDFDGLEDAQATTSDSGFAGGTKQDATCPTVITAKAPNKDDLKRAYFASKTAANGDIFLELAWVRITQNTTSPSAHVAFEFNQSKTLCGGNSGKLVTRTLGDMLIVYDFEGGSTDNPTLTLSRWITSGGPCEVASNSPPCWGVADELDAQESEAKVNTSIVGPVLDEVADPDETLKLNEFGEAGINLTKAGVFNSGQCVSFGNAYAVSRTSGSSSTAQMKDLVGPGDVEIQNCGKVIIRKVTDPASDPATNQFGYTKSFPTQPVSDNAFTLGHGQSKTFTGVLQGTGYTVDETTLPAGWDFDNVDCSASTGVTPSITGSLVTFDINSANDILDCTYTNKGRGTIIVEKITDDGSGAFDFTSGKLGPFTLTTTAAGEVGKDSETFGNLVPGTYDVAETVPANWNLVSSSCNDGSDPATIGLSSGETVTCTFHDAREKGAIVISKTRKHAAEGSGDHAHAGVKFTVTGGELPAAGVTATTNANGEACVDGLVLSALAGGDYTVTETLPAGYHADGPLAKPVTVAAEATCGPPRTGTPATVSFSNTPLTDLSVSVDSQVAGGTDSQINCVNDAAPGTSIASHDTDATGDGSASATDLEPGNYTCTIVIDP